MGLSKVIAPDVYQTTAQTSKKSPTGSTRLLPSSLATRKHCRPACTPWGVQGMETSMSPAGRPSPLFLSHRGPLLQQHLRLYTFAALIIPVE